MCVCRVLSELYFCTEGGFGPLLWDDQEPIGTKCFLLWRLARKNFPQIYLSICWWKKNHPKTTFWGIPAEKILSSSRQVFTPVGVDPPQGGSGPPSITNLIICVRVFNFSDLN